MPHPELQAIQTRIYDFLERTNKAWSQGKPDVPTLFYNGEYITGCLHEPKFLFIGINPGFGADWKTHPRSCDYVELDTGDCKFIEEYEDKAPLASAIVDCLLGGNDGIFRNCAETSFRSFFCSPSEKELNEQLAHLGRIGMLAEHQKMMQEAIPTIIKQVKPQNIVCIGFGTFNGFVKQFRIPENQIAIEAPIEYAAGKFVHFYKRTEFNGVAVHGIPHLSGARVSNAAKGKIKEIFLRVNAQ